LKVHPHRAYIEIDEPCQDLGPVPVSLVSHPTAPSFRLSGYVDGAITVSHERQNPLDLCLVGGYELTTA